MLKVQYIFVKQEEGKNEKLISLMEHNNPTVFPRKDEFINIQDTRFIVTGVEWIPLRELVNIYMVYAE